MREEKVRYPVRAAERILLILQTFSSRRTQQDYLSIAEQTNIPQSTAFKLLQMLVEKRFLETNGEQGTYRIGPEIFRLGSLYLADRTLVEVAKPLLETLANRFGVLATLGIRDGTDLLSLLSKQGTGMISLSRPAGERWPLVLSAIGQSLMLDLPDEDLDIFSPIDPSERYTPKSITTVEQLIEELSEARQRGYTIDDEGSSIGIFCVGAPIRDHEGEIIAAISITGVKAAIIDHVADIAAEVCRVAEVISRALGYIHAHERSTSKP